MDINSKKTKDTYEAPTYCICNVSVESGFDGSAGDSTVVDFPEDE